jgi:stalled ribosome rescue protein Dom34
MSPTPLFHAVVWIDHQSAQVLQFDAEHVQARKVKAHGHHTRQHGSAVRSEHEFFSEVCDALTGIKEVLVTGSHTAQVDFQHFTEKHRPAIAAQVVGYETVDHPSENQLVAMARKYFVRFDRMVGVPTPG